MIAHQDVQRFCIVSVARTGSSTLCFYIGQHSDVACHGEPFHPDTPTHLYYGVADKIDVSNRETNPVRFVNDVYDLTPPRRFVGFKIMAGQSKEAIDYILLEPGIKKIVLERRNYLAAYSSYKMAVKTNLWNARHPIADETKAVFEPAEFDRFVRWYKTYFSGVREKLSRGEQEYLDVYYSSSAMEKVGEDVLTYFGLSTPDGAKAQYVKLRSSDILTRFTDPESVSKELQKRSLEEWAEES